jgi:hypothetical protein
MLLIGVAASARWPRPLPAVAPLPRAPRTVAAKRARTSRAIARPAALRQLDRQDKLQRSARRPGQSKTQHPVRAASPGPTGRDGRPAAPFGFAREVETAPWHRPPHRPGPVPAFWAGVSCREGRCAACLHCAAGTRGQVSWWFSRVAYMVPELCWEHPRRRSPKGEAKRRGLQRVIGRPQTCQGDQVHAWRKLVSSLH